jgi:branched-subunit amino acid ABC-type transport system permease component
MRKYVVEFLKRGMMFCFGGPLVMAIVYFVLGAFGELQTLTVNEVVSGIFSSTLLAFIAAGMTVVYTVDKLSPFSAALIHGVALYLDYILLYLFNGWLQSSIKPIMIFTICFVLGYLVIWAIVYCLTKNSTRKMNEGLEFRK